MLLILIKKFVGKLQPSAAAGSTESVEARVLAVQQGTDDVRNQFIVDYQPFVARVTSRFRKRFIDPAHDDEFNIALLAFNEAIDNYDASNGASFFHFAETVIKRRLIDYVRKEQKHQAVIPYSTFEVQEEEGDPMNPIEVRQAIDTYDEQQRNDERRSEIIELNEQLKAYGITFQDLVTGSPKHADSREALMAIGCLLADRSDLMELLQKKKMLPIKELLNVVSVSRKTLERNRKYIIAIAIIRSGLFPYLSDYLQVEKPVINEEKGVGTHA